MAGYIWVICAIGDRPLLASRIENNEVFARKGLAHAQHLARETLFHSQELANVHRI